MASEMTPELQLSLKRQAASHAVTFVESGMVVGLGHGSTAILAVQQLATKLARRELSDIQGIPCSRTVRAKALRLGIPLTTLEEHPVIDLTIDGADEVDPALNLIKGGGGRSCGRRSSRRSAAAKLSSSMLRRCHRLWGHTGQCPWK